MIGTPRAITTLLVMAAALSLSPVAAAADGPKSIRIGYAISLTGPNAVGAGVTFNNAASGSNPAQTGNSAITLDGSKTGRSVYTS